MVNKISLSGTEPSTSCIAGTNILTSPILSYRVVKFFDYVFPAVKL